MAIIEGKEGAFRYILYIPTHLSEEASINLPLVVVLHGSGEIGSSLSKLKKREPYLSLKNGKFEPDCLVLMPQLPKKNWGYYADDLIKLIDSVKTERCCDCARVSLTGHSLGGMGVIEVMLKYPGYFSAGAVLSCCKDYSKDLEKLSRIPLWFIYGSKERTYGKYAMSMFKKMDSLNSFSNLTKIPGYGHPIQFVWTREEYNIFKWLTFFKVGDMKNPSWQWLLKSLGIFDEEGRLDLSLLDEEISDGVAKAFNLKKGPYCSN